MHKCSLRYLLPREEHNWYNCKKKVLSAMNDFESIFDIGNFIELKE